MSAGWAPVRTISGACCERPFPRSSPSCSSLPAGRARKPPRLRRRPSSRPRRLPPGRHRTSCPPWPSGSRICRTPSRFDARATCRCRRATSSRSTAASSTRARRRSESRSSSICRATSRCSRTRSPLRPPSAASSRHCWATRSRRRSPTSSYTPWASRPRTSKGRRSQLARLGESGVVAQARFDTSAGRAEAVYVVVQVGSLHHSLFLIGAPGQVKVDDARELARAVIPRLQQASGSAFAA